MDNEPEPTNLPPMSDNGGQGRTPADIVRQSPSTSGQAREEHALTTNEATKLFERAGFPRSQRSMERYCKSGELDCVVDPDEERYYITMASIDRVIGKLEEIKARHVQLGTDKRDPVKGGDAGQSRPSPDVGNDAPESDNDSGKRIKELEFKLRDAEIGSRAKDLHIERQNAERDWLLNQLIEGSRRIGILETKLLQLETPKANHPNQDEGKIGAEVEEAGVTESQGLEQEDAGQA